VSVVSFEGVPQTGRLWIYGSRIPLSHEQIASIRKKMDAFVENWVSHKKDVTGGWTLRYDRFILVAVDESRAQVSGCSIDSLVKALKTIDQETGSDFLQNSARVFFRDRSDKIRCVDREAFGEMVTKGLANDQTLVFDNSIGSVVDVLNGRWERMMKDSWHGKVFAAAVD